MSVAAGNSLYHERYISIQRRCSRSREWQLLCAYQFIPPLYKDLGLNTIFYLKTRVPAQNASFTAVDLSCYRQFLLSSTRKRLWR